MKNTRLIWIVAALLDASAPALVAQTSTNASTNAPVAGQITPADLQALRTMTPQQRQEFMKNHPGLAQAQGLAAANSYYSRLGIDPKEFQTLSPAQRQAKLNEATDKKIEELNKKKADGTITPADQAFLNQLEMRKKFAARMQQGTNAPAAPATPTPAAEKK